MTRSYVLLPLLALLAWLVSSAIVFVDQAEAVYVTQFGRHVATYNGASEAGLHFKFPWPIQRVVRFDRRLHDFDVPTQELPIKDRDPNDPNKVNSLLLTFDFYVCWRIDARGGDDAAGIDRFFRSFGSTENAQAFLRSQVINWLKVDLSRLYLAELVNRDPSQLTIDQALDRLRSTMDERARPYGVEIVDIRLRRFNHPPSAREENYAKIRRAKEEEARGYENQARENTARTLATARDEAEAKRRKAREYKETMDGQAAAARLQTQLQMAREEPHLYSLVQGLDAYRSMFANKQTQFAISLGHPLMGLFQSWPGFLPPPRNGVTPGGRKDQEPGGQEPNKPQGSISNSPRPILGS